MTDWNYAAWANAMGEVALKGRIETHTKLKAEATTLINILLVGIGAGMAYVIQAFESEVTAIVFGVVAATIWMAGVAALLVHKCISTRHVAIEGNLPLSVYKPDLGLSQDQVLAYNMADVQACIELMLEVNESVAMYLDRLRYAAIGTPIVLAISVAAYWAYQLVV